MSAFATYQQPAEWILAGKSAATDCCDFFIFASLHLHAHHLEHFLTAAPVQILFRVGDGNMASECLDLFAYGIDVLLLIGTQCAIHTADHL